MPTHSTVRLGGLPRGDQGCLHTPARYCLQHLCGNGAVYPNAADPDAQTGPDMGIIAATLPSDSSGVR